MFEQKTNAIPVKAPCESYESNIGILFENLIQVNRWFQILYLTLYFSIIC